MNNQKSVKGKVWLAGAGPGEAGLLTIKTMSLINEVDIILYDALVSPEILSLLPSDKRLVCVGKKTGNHTVSQDEINKILLSEALAGNRVLRLKGGDPFVFGRGGEELELLIKNNVPFEIIPGVTSATAVPAYAGIPVTHRDFASSLHIITGHSRDGEVPVDFAALAGLDGTLVFLMGMSMLDKICSGLLDAGMDKKTPVAIIQNGTTASQRSLATTLEKAYEEARSADMGPPAIIVIGKVCNLEDSFKWIERRVLNGVRIMTAGSRKSNKLIADKLNRLGAHVIELNTIKTRLLDIREELGIFLDRTDTVLPEIWIAFTSSAGVEMFFENLAINELDIRTILNKSEIIRFGAVGYETARKLRSFGFVADVVPHKYNSLELGKEIAKQAGKNSTIMTIRAEKGAEELLKPLSDAGMDIYDIPVYETKSCLHSGIEKELTDLYRSGYIHASVFTSASSVEGFVRILKDIDYSKVVAICIGEQTAKAAEKNRMQTITASFASIDGIVETIIDKYGNKEIYSERGE